jgi:hypothetical protein
MNKVLGFTILVLFFLISCRQSEYNKLIKEEMSKNIIHDTILLGHKFGQTKDEFFEICWQLNKKKIVKQGGKSNTVEYIIPKGASSPAIKMLFYGKFNEKDIMTGIEAEFSYPAWSLWNKNYHSDKLALALKDTLKSWFPGNEFIVINGSKLKKEFFVKIDGNRQIVIEPLTNTKDVKIRIEDLRFKDLGL